MSDSYVQVLAESQAQWRAWLEAHHDTSPGIWLVTWKKASGRPLLSYDAIVDEALCYGWVDSRPRSIDGRRSARLVTPRKPASNWSARNKTRVEQLTAAGRMHPSGLAAVAKANGAWTVLDHVETLAEPPDLTAALDAAPVPAATGTPSPARPGGRSSSGSPGRHRLAHAHAGTGESAHFSLSQPGPKDPAVRITGARPGTARGDRSPRARRPRYRK